jgi:glycosyltransferase involved in cell wall biosynthesis
MRILMLAPSFHPVIGGAETYAYTVATGLTARGHVVSVVTDEPRAGTAGRSGDPDGVNVHRLVGYRDYLFAEDRLPWEEMAFGLAPEIERMAHEAAPDVVMSNSLDTAIQAATLALHAKLPWAACFHEQEPESAPLGIGRLRLVYGRLSPDLVLAGSEFYADRARVFGDPSRVVMIHHGVPDLHEEGMRAAPMMRQRYGVTDRELLVVCAGRLKRRKGMLELVQAFSRLNEDFPAARLVLAGSVNSADRSYADLLARSIADLGLENVVSIDETVGLTQMPGLLAAADIVAQPSLQEGLGLAVLEAMNAARPVIATDIPGTREILFAPDIALVVPPGDVSSIVDALKKLLHDTEGRRRLGDRARAHVLSNFSVDQMLERTEMALELAVGKFGQRGSGIE